MEQITPGTVVVSDAYLRLFLSGTAQFSSAYYTYCLLPRHFNKTQFHTRDYFLDDCKNMTVIL